MKNLKSIDLSSATIIGTSISFFWGVILAIIFVASLTIISGFDVNLIIMALSIVFTVLVLSIPKHFGSAYLFNFLIKRLNNVELEIVDMKKITKVSTSFLAFICSVVSLIIILILFPIILIGVSLLSPIVQLLASEGIGVLVYLLIFISSPLIIAYVFIATFIIVTIATMLFNAIAPKIGGLELNLTKVGNFTQINSVEPSKLALISGIILAVLGIIAGLILSIIAMNLLGNLLLIIYLAVGGLVGGLIIGALIAIFYNFLAPRLGELKLELE